MSIYSVCGCYWDVVTNQWEAYSLKVKVISWVYTPYAGVTGMLSQIRDAYRLKVTGMLYKEAYSLKVKVTSWVYTPYAGVTGMLSQINEKLTV